MSYHFKILTPELCNLQTFVSKNNRQVKTVYSREIYKTMYIVFGQGIYESFIKITRVYIDYYYCKEKI